MAELLPPPVPQLPVPVRPGYPRAVAQRVSEEELESVVQPFLEFAALIRRRIWLVVGVAALPVAAVGYSVYRERPVYRATSTVQLSDERRELSGKLAGISDFIGLGQGTDRIASAVQVLQSRAVAKEVVEREGLRLRVRSRGFSTGSLQGVHVAPDTRLSTVHLEFAPKEVTARSSDKTARAAYGAPLDIDGVQFTVPARPQVETAELAVMPLDAAVRAFVQNVRGRPHDKTDLIDIDYSAADPITAQRVASTTAQVYQEMTTRTARQKSVRRREFLAGQLEKTNATLSEAQLALNAFRSREKVYSSQEKFRTQQAGLTSIQVRREELNADRGVYQSLLEGLQRPRDPNSTQPRFSTLAATPGISENPVLTRQFASLEDFEARRDSMTAAGVAPDNPDMKSLNRMIATTETKVISSVQGQIGALDARIAALDDLQTRSASDITGAPKSESEEAMLVEAVASTKRVADQLREELQKAQIDEAVEAGPVEIVDLADLPTSPIGAPPATKLALGLVVGLLLGGAGAYLYENRTSVIRRKEELDEVAALPNLGLIPRVELSAEARKLIAMRANGNGNGNGHAKALTDGSRAALVTVADHSSTGAEAFRTLRTNLLFSDVTNSVKSLVVTSAEPGDGKTTTAANLAVTYAQQGLRVLLIDCDLRRASVHRVFRTPLEPGLTQVLLNHSVAAQAIHSTAVEGLFVLSAGTIPPNPSELLGSAIMRNTLMMLQDTFDLVILDSPPVLLASDAAILAKLTDGALVVVRAGHTERGAVHQVVEQLGGVGARILGTVLNDPDAEVAKYRGSYYGYRYYNYRYAQGKA